MLIDKSVEDEFGHIIHMNTTIYLPEMDKSSQMYKSSPNVNLVSDNLSVV